MRLNLSVARGITSPHSPNPSPLSAGGEGRGKSAIRRTGEG